ncbi:MAG: Ig-like domain-containing protein [Pseudomonadota bacterium]|nr:Ig-like domain-containing protein [Pseudomonadota bacterium]
MNTKRVIQKFYMIGILILLLSMVISGCSKPKLERVEIKPAEKTLAVGATLSFEATAISSENKKMPDAVFNWTVDSNKGAIDENGRLSAKIPGQIKITVTSKGVSAQAQVTIIPVEVADIKVQVDNEKALAGTSTKLTVKTLSKGKKPAGFNTILISSPTKGIKLSTEKLTMNQQGKSEIELALSSTPGTNTVILKAGKITKKIQIEGTPITSITITPEKKVFEVGESIQFKAEGYDKFGNHRPVQARWSMAKKNAVLKDKGMVLAKKPGDCILLAHLEKITTGRPFTIVPGKLNKIECKPESIKIPAGQTAQIKVKGFNKYGHQLPVEVEWSVENNLGTVAKDGIFTAKKVGNGVVKVAKEGVFSEVKVEIEHGPLADIRIKIKDKQIEAGKTINLKAAGVDAYGNEFSIDPQWLLSRSMGTIDKEKSTFTALRSGIGEIRAKVENILESYQVEIIPTVLSQLQISPESVDMLAGETKQFIVTGYDSFGNKVTTQTRFFMKKELGELSPDGIFQAKKAGNTIIEAKMKNLTAKSTIAVAPAKMKEVVIKPKGPLSLQAGKTQHFLASGLDPYGNIVKSAVSWSLPTELGTIDDHGVFMPTKSGQGQVVATVKQLRTDRVLNIQVPIDIAPGEPTQIKLEPVKLKITAGEEKYFAAAIHDAYGNKTVTALKWSVKDFPADSIDNRGLFKAIKAGRGKIKVAGGNLMAEAEVQVLPAEISFLKITPGTISAKAGEKIHLDAVGEDRFGNVVDALVIWSLTDTRLGTITSENYLLPAKKGKGFLMATAGDIVERIPLEVMRGELSSFKVVPTKQVVTSGKKFQFKAIGFDVGGNKLAVKPTWSIQKKKDLGNIDDNGLFVAKKTGTGTVEVKSNGIKATTEIEVIVGEAASISVIPDKVNITAGNEVKFEVEVFDANANLISLPKYSWSVQGELGKVTRNNLFLAHKAGTGVLTITSGKAVTKIHAEVNVGGVKRIRVSPETIVLKANSSITFEAKGYDQEGNEVKLQPAWSVAGGIGSINNDGKFEAQITGHGNVSCQMADIFGLSSVEVKPGTIKSIKIDPPETVLTAGESITFGATAYDVYGNVCPADFSWNLEAEKSLGTFTTSGRFKAEITGEGKIVASANKIKGYSKIKVKPAVLNRVTITPKSLSLVSGKDTQFTALGKDQFNNLISISPRWSVEPKEIGKITPEGIFYAQKAGKGTLKVTAEGIENSVSIEVKAGEPKYLRIKAPTSPVMAGKTYPFTVVGYDEGGNTFPIKAEWAVTKDLGNIEKDTGIFHAAKPGKGTIIAHSGEIIIDMPVEVKPGELTHLFIEPNTITVASNTKQKFMVHGLDIEKNKVELPSPVWKVQGSIGIFKEPGIFHGTSQGKGKVTASVGKLRAEAYVTVIPGQPDSANSRLRLNHTSIPADGVTVAEIIVEVYDVYNNFVPDIEVKLISDRQGDIIQQPAKTNRKGLTTGTIGSTEPGTATISALIKDMPFRDTARIVFRDK